MSKTNGRPLRKARLFHFIDREPLKIGWTVRTTVLFTNPENWITKNWFLTRKQARRFAGWDEDA